MKTVVVANPQAAAGAVGRGWGRYHSIVNDCFGGAEVRMTAGPKDATRLVRESILEGYERVVVVGGDGSVNEAVNGFFAEDGSPLGADVSLAYVPAGTGGDFARSVGLRDVDARRVLHTASDRKIDLGRATMTAPDGSEIVRHFVNISSFGSSGLIVDKVNKTSKALGGKASFMLGTVKGLAAYRNKLVRIRIDDFFEEEVRINTVAVANGRFFGGSMMVAPNAVLDDGLFDVVILGDLGLRGFIQHASKLYKGTHLSLPQVREYRGRVVTASSVDGSDVLIDLDGEQPGRLPATYEVVPKALTLFAPWDSAVAAFA